MSWSRRKATLTASAAGALVTGTLAFALVSASAPAAGATLAATTTSTATHPAFAGHHRPHPMGRRWMGPGMGPGIAGRALYGQFVVHKSSGYQTVEFQRGVVTAVSGASLTVRSANKHTVTYQVSPSTIVDAQRAGIASVVDGNRVEVVARSASGGLTATRIIDLSLVGHAFPMPPRAAAPKPPATSSGTSGA